jgi:hypothetical protein
VAHAEDLKFEIANFRIQDSKFNFRDSRFKNVQKSGDTEDLKFEIGDFRFQDSKFGFSDSGKIADSRVKKIQESRDSAFQIQDCRFKKDSRFKIQGHTRMPRLRLPYSGFQIPHSRKFPDFRYQISDSRTSSSFSLAGPPY